MTYAGQGLTIVLFAIFTELATATKADTITCYFENYYGFADGVQACKAKQCFRALRDDGKLTRGCVYDSHLCDRPNRTCCDESFCNGIATAVLLNQEMKKLNGAFSELSVELVFCTVAATGIAANLLVMVAVFGDRKLRQNSMFLLLANWAFSDAAYLCVSSIMALVAISHAASLDRDLLITQIAFYFAKVSIFESTYTNFAVSVERYYAAVFPLECALEFRPKRTVGYVAKVWAVALLFNAFWIALLIQPSLPQDYYIFTDVFIVYLIPVGFMSYFYAYTCRVLWSSGQELLVSRANFRPPAREPLPSSRVQPVALLKRRTNKDILASRRAAIKMLVVCAVVFYIFYTPWAVVLAMASMRTEFPTVMVLPSLMMTFVACSVNPFVYTFYSGVFQRRIATIFSRLICCRS